MPSPLHNQSTAALADEFGNLKAQIATLEEKADALKAELTARIDDVPAIGARWTVTKSVSTSKRLDTKKLLADLGDALDTYEVASTSTRVLVKPTMIFSEAAE